MLSINIFPNAALHLSIFSSMKIVLYYMHITVCTCSPYMYVYNTHYIYTYVPPIPMGGDSPLVCRYSVPLATAQGTMLQGEGNM